MKNIGASIDAGSLVGTVGGAAGNGISANDLESMQNNLEDVIN